MLQRPLLMIVGGGLFQCRAVEEAKSLGLQVLVFDQDPHAPARKLADHFEEVSTKDIPQLIQSAAPYFETHKVRGVFTAGTDVAYSVAAIAKAYRLPGIEPEVALKATNKFLMRQCLKEAGLTVPLFLSAQDLREAKEAASSIGFPLVIKPVDSMGARGVRQIRNEEELDDYFDTSIRFSGRYSEASVILESYLPADEISMDTLMIDGKMYLISIADREISEPPYFIERGHSLPSRLPENRLREAFEEMQKAAEAIGIQSGAVKADIRVAEEAIYIGEITARLSGGFHSQYTEKYAYGTNSTKAAIQVAIKDPVDLNLLKKKHQKVCMERAMICKPGMIESITGVDEAQKIPGIHHVFFNLGVGDEVKELKSNIGKVANIIASGDTFEEVEATIQKAIDLIKINIVSHQTVKQVS